jgi:hypothetical protein
MVHDRSSSTRESEGLELAIAVEDAGGKLAWLKWSGRSGGGSTPVPPTVQRIQNQYSGIEWPKDFKIAHIVVSRLVEYPRLHKFTLKNVKLAPPPAPPPGVKPPVKAIAQVSR